MSASFGADKRLHRPEEFSVVLESRRTIRGASFVLHYRLAPESEPSTFDADRQTGAMRLGLIVPKRMAKASSLRNAIKRQGREAFRLFCDAKQRSATYPGDAPATAPLPSPRYDLVLRLARPVKDVRASDGAAKKRWRAEIERLLQQLAS